MGLSFGSQQAKDEGRTTNDDRECPSDRFDSNSPCIELVERCSFPFGGVESLFSHRVVVPEQTPLDEEATSVVFQQ